MNVSVSIARSQEEFFQLIRLREQVFVREQRVPMEIELDGDDSRAIHLVARKGMEIIGTARLAVDGSIGKIGRMAVKSEYRRRKVGESLVNMLLRVSEEQGLHRLVLHAQDHAVPFYEEMGFDSEGPPFLESGILHQKMVRDVRPPNPSKVRPPLD